MPTLCAQNNNDNPTTTKTGGSARFTFLDETQDATSLLDVFLTFLSSDIASIVLGLLGLVVCVVNRLNALENDDISSIEQSTRADLLAVFATLAVLLNGISKLDVTSALAESVTLDGVTLDEPEYSNSVKRKSELDWAFQSLLTATPAKTAVLLQQQDSNENGWTIVASAGVVPKEEEVRSFLSRETPILDRFRRNNNNSESYLPTLQALPGRFEFTYLPPNTQGALLLPVKSNNAAAAVLVLGSDTAKSFTPRDIAWCQVLASRIGQFIEED